MFFLRRAMRPVINLLGAGFLTRVVYSLYRLGERFGVHILPAHFYSPLPNIRELKSFQHAWCKRSDLPGIHVDVEKQMDTLTRVCLPHQHECLSGDFLQAAERTDLGTGYGHIEAQVLHSIVRHYKPKTIVEVGSGLSTTISLAAARSNEDDGAGPCRIVCVEPYPRPALDRLPGIELIKKRVQELPPEFFLDNLGSRGLLFVDSSHVVKPGGDVNHIYLEVLPRLDGGILFHAHDTNFPFDYDRALLRKAFGCFRTEPSLLRALMVNNDRMEILFSLSMLHYDAPERLKRLFPEHAPQSNSPTGLASRNEDIYGKHFPSSTWLILH